jgi:putative membrane protein insertion efficiency factor
MTIVAAVRGVPTAVLVGLIRVYQAVISPLLGSTCKYHPSCSNYALIAIRRHGALRGTGLALWRIQRDQRGPHDEREHDD